MSTDQYVSLWVLAIVVAWICLCALIAWVWRRWVGTRTVLDELAGDELPQISGRHLHSGNSSVVQLMRRSGQGPHQARERD